jgi:hypothetical protein
LKVCLRNIVVILATLRILYHYFSSLSIVFLTFSTICLTLSSSHDLKVSNFSTSINVFLL